MTRRLFIVLAFVLSGCGGNSYIALDVSGDCGGALCEVPASVNGIVVRTFDAADLTTALLEETVTLSDETFPVRILLEPGDGTPERLTQQVLLELDGARVASGAVEHGWESGKTNRVQIVVEVP